MHNTNINLKMTIEQFSRALGTICRIQQILFFELEAIERTQSLLDEFGVVHWEDDEFTPVGDEVYTKLETITYKLDSLIRNYNFTEVIDRLTDLVLKQGTVMFNVSNEKDNEVFLDNAEVVHELQQGIIMLNKIVHQIKND